MRFYLSLFVVLVVPAAAFAQADPLKAQADRVAVVAKVKPSVVAVFARGGQGGGTGVLISDDGYALTNFHVVQPTGPTMQCGLPDGVLYDAVLVGLDRVGDVALIKLLPKKEGQKFPAAPLGDSDLVREGDWSIAMGNPFLLATDFNPTITFGLVSGVHRYQYPSGLILEYTDCIQIDTSINPGNSGGPLFNSKGELIGINGRGSFDKRGRINSGVGYAISINQIKNFMGHLYAGLDTDHASLGALVTTQTEKTGLGRMVVTSILEESDVARRGLELEDEILSFAGRSVSSVNQYRNVLGIYPRGWRVPMEYRRDQARKEVLVRLMGMQRKVIAEDPSVPPPEGKPPEGKPKPPDGGKPPDGKPGGKPIIKGKPAGPQGPAAKYYTAKAGYANYYFNKVEQDRLMKAFKKHGDFSSVPGAWNLQGGIKFKKVRTEESPIKIDITEKTDKEGKNSSPYVYMKIGKDYDTSLEPFKDGLAPVQLREPREAGYFLPALYLYHRLLTHGEKGFTEFTHAGHEPLYPPPVESKTEAGLGSRRLDCEVLSTRFGPYLAKWFFARSDQKLAGFEVRLEDNEDPCEVYLSDYRPVEAGKLLPHRMTVLYGNGTYGTITFTNFGLNK